MTSILLFKHHIRTPFIFLLLSEYALLFLSIYAGFYLRFDFVVWDPVLIPELPSKSLVYASTMVLGLVAMGQYQAPNPQGTYFLPYVFIRISISLLLGTIGLLVVYYIFPSILIGRGVNGYALASSVFILTMYRIIVFKAIDSSKLKKKILVLGAGKLAADILQNDRISGANAVSRALAPKYASYTIHGFIKTEGEGVCVPEMYLVRPGERLVAYCLEYEIDEIVLAISDRRKSVPVDDLLDCKLSNIDILEYVAFWEKEKGLLRTDMLNPSWLIFCDGCSQGDFDVFFTRVFDIAVSVLILILMFPILLVTALLIFIENRFKGPIFYSQERVGFNNINFRLLKFRSMIVNAEKDGKARWAEENDVRVTKIGRFIRKFRIDELPQMINILKGDMCLVGPRPERPEFVKVLEDKIPFYATRHRVKPGIAGWAQLKYPYGSDVKDANMKLQYDLFYVKNHSIWMDLLVLLQTIEVVLLGKGAR